MTQQFRRQLAAVTARIAIGKEHSEGPWGSIEAVQLPLMNPGQSIPDAASRLRPPAWFFANWTETKLIEFVASCHLTAPERDAILDKSHWVMATNGVTVMPPTWVVRSITPETRARIYAELSQDPVNYAQFYPFCFPRHVGAGCLRTLGLSPEGVSNVTALTYEQAGAICLADLHVARELLAAPDFQRLTDALYEFPAYRARLVLTPDSDIEPLVSYWGAGGRTNLIRPLLMSLERAPADQTINISYLLPPFPRLRLYTFPAQRSDNLKEDCLYSALNFFNDVANTNFFNPEYAWNTIATRYVPVSGDPAFGDLLLLLDGNSNAVHACSFVASDLVFTKNGVNPTQPWALMKLSDVLHTYHVSGETGVAILRSKDVHPQADTMKVAQANSAN